MLNHFKSVKFKFIIIGRDFIYKKNWDTFVIKELKTTKEKKENTIQHYYVSGKLLFSTMGYITLWKYNMLE